MRTTLLLAAMALLSATIAGPAAAADRDSGQQKAASSNGYGFDHGMQPVPHNAGPQERAHGWRYFSDPMARRAVVISPQGDYYLSQGKGLRWVAGAQA